MANAMYMQWRQISAEYVFGEQTSTLKTITLGTSSAACAFQSKSGLLTNGGYECVFFVMFIYNWTLTEIC